MDLHVFIFAIICILCIVASRFSYKLGVPSLLLFIIIGMLFGSDGIFKIHFDNFALSEQLCTIALIFIIFYGGFGMNLKSAKPIVGKALLLSTLGVVMTALISGYLCHVVLKVSLVEGFLIGSVLASTDAASVFSILRSKKLNLKNGIAPLLEMESGSNDPISYMMTTLILGYMVTKSLDDLPRLLLLQIGLGVLCGFVIGKLGSRILRYLKFRDHALMSIMVAAIAMLAYALPSMFSGNGFLSVYIVGILLGDQKFRYKVELVHFFDGITQMMQILLFFTLGLLAFPSQIPQVIFPALAVMFFITFIARPLSVFVLLTPFKVKWNEQLFIAWSGLRGAASIVFAILCVVSPASTNKDVFHIVFVVSLLSVAFQGTFLPQMARILKVEDQSNDTMKTFNDYHEDNGMSLVETSLPVNHDWVNKTLEDIVMPENMLVALIIRGEVNIFPKGDTVIKANDTVVLCAQNFYDHTDIVLEQQTMDENHHWIGKDMNKIDFGNHLLVLSIKRNKKIIIPKGDTEILEGDTLIFMDIGNNAIERF